MKLKFILRTKFRYLLWNIFFSSCQIMHKPTGIQRPTSFHTSLRCDLSPGVFCGETASSLWKKSTADHDVENKENHFRGLVSPSSSQCSPDMSDISPLVTPSRVCVPLCDLTPSIHHIIPSTPWTCATPLSEDEAGLCTPGRTFGSTPVESLYLQLAKSRRERDESEGRLRDAEEVRMAGAQATAKAHLLTRHTPPLPLARCRGTAMR